MLYVYPLMLKIQCTEIKDGKYTRVNDHEGLLRLIVVTTSSKNEIRIKIVKD